MEQSIKDASVLMEMPTQEEMTNKIKEWENPEREMLGTTYYWVYMGWRWLNRCVIEMDFSLFTERQKEISERQ